MKMYAPFLPLFFLSHFFLWLPFLNLLLLLYFRPLCLLTVGKEAHKFCPSFSITFNGWCTLTCEYLREFSDKFKIHCPFINEILSVLSKAHRA
jgi:hypothetical protein